MSLPRTRCHAAAFHERFRSHAAALTAGEQIRALLAAKGRRPLAPDIAVERLRSMSLWRIHSPRADDAIAAAQLSQRNQLWFWDAMIVRSAAELRCDVLWSEDLNDGQAIEGVRIRDPFGLSSAP